jgi:hypothetical protein
MSLAYENNVAQINASVVFWAKNSRRVSHNTKLTQLKLNFQKK